MVREMNTTGLGPSADWAHPLEAVSSKRDRQQERRIPLITPILPKLVKINWKRVCRKKKQKET